MFPLRYRWWWLGAGIGALLVIFGLALAPLAAPLPVRGGDKILHFLAFAFLTVWFLGIFRPRLTWRVAAALALYGGLIELAQSFLPHRFPESQDVLSDVAGILAGWLLAAAGLRAWCQRIEALLGVTAVNGRR